MYWFPYSSHTSHHPSQTPRLPWIFYASQKLMLDSCKILQKQSEAFHTFLWHFLPSLKQNFIAYRSSKVSSHLDCIFEIDQLWQSGFSRLYSNCCSSCSFKAEIIKIVQSSHKMYTNNILNFQESTTILNPCTKKSLETYWRHHVFWWHNIRQEIKKILVSLVKKKISFFLNVFKETVTFNRRKSLSVA